MINSPQQGSLAPEYPYSDLKRIDTRKPYNFSSYGGRGFLTAFAADRNGLMQILEEMGQLSMQINAPLIPTI